MAHTLADFCRNANKSLKSKPLADALPAIADDLAELLKTPAFVAETFKEDTPEGKRELYHDAETDFYVLAHVQGAGKAGKPHDHGTSWAIYGNARAVTQMTEFKRVNAATADHAELARTEDYGLGPGQTRAFPPGVIHCTSHPQKAWVIRVLGADLDKTPRYHFRKTDRIVEPA